MANVDQISGAVYTATTCNCIAFIFALFVAFSPYWIWGTGFINGYSSTVGSGSFAMSSYTTPSVYWGVYYGQWNYWSQVQPSDNPCDNSVISNNLFDNWSGKYKMCDKVDGTFSIPTEAKVLQAFATLACIFAFLGTCVGGAVKSGGGAQGAKAAGCISFLTMIFSIVAFAYYCNWAWIQDLRTGNGYMPIYVKDATGSGIHLEALKVSTLWYGPAFGCMVTVFVCTLFSTVAFCAAAKPIEDELDGGFGSGAKFV